MASVREEAQRLASLARAPAEQAKRLIGRMFGAHRDAVALFCGSDGELRPEAVSWFARLAADNFVQGTTFVAGDRDAMIKNEGRRELALEILASVRIDQARLARLNRQAREAENERRD